MSKKEKFLILATFLAMAAVMSIIMFGIIGTASSLEKMKTIKGTVHYISIEGGFWGIVTDDGKKYDPIYLPSELRRPGLRAEFRLMILEGHVGLRMWGTLVEILDYAIIQ
ncbi:MAG: hypothetical protein Q8N42_00780 [bacterium]|nr:hypothetical protein [bacterium]